MMRSLAKPLSASLLALSIALSSLWHPAQAGQFCWQSIKGDVLLDIACEAGYSACGAFIRPCTNATHTGCTTEEILRSALKTEYSCFLSVESCKQVANLTGQGVTLLTCCEDRNCNTPLGNSGFLSSQPRMLLVLAASALATFLALTLTWL